MAQATTCESCQPLFRVQLKQLKRYSVKSLFLAALASVVEYQRWSRGHKARGQGQGPRTQAQVFSKKKEGLEFSSELKKQVFKIFFQAKKVFKNFFRRFPLEENKKRSLQIFCEVSGTFQQNFNGSKNSAALEPRTGQFSKT